MGQVESNPPPPSDHQNTSDQTIFFESSPPKQQLLSPPSAKSPSPETQPTVLKNKDSRIRRKATSDGAFSSSNEIHPDPTHSPPSYTSFAGRAARVPFSWASQGAELVATTTVDVALSTMNVAMKTASVFVSTTESAGNMVAHNVTNVSIKTASVATQTASLITSVASAGVKTTGEAIAGTANLVVEGFIPAAAASTVHSPLNSPSNNTSPKQRPMSRSHPEETLLLPEAASSEVNQSSMRDVVGSRFWNMLGATNESARRHWVFTVTSTKNTPPSAKYLKKILILAYETKGQSLYEFYRFLPSRPIFTSPICALKSLITCLRLMREGPPEALQASIANVTLVDTLGAFWAEKIFLNNKEESLNEHMLIARLSGFIVQKMHFHAKTTYMNARYEKIADEEYHLAHIAEERSSSAEDEEDSRFESMVEMASSLLTLLGTIEGVARLALNEDNSCPGPTALYLATLLVEEALGAFDALTSCLGGSHRELDNNALVRSLKNRHQSAYNTIHKFCTKALTFPYIVALNKVPVLSPDLISQEHRLSVVSPPPAAMSPSHGSTTGSTGAFSPWTLFTSSATTTTAKHGPTLATAASSSSSSSAFAPNASHAQIHSERNLVTEERLLRPFTRASILEHLEEEEKLMDLLVIKNSDTPSLIASSSSPTLVLPEWDVYCSMDNARPPLQFEAEDDENDDNDDGQEVSLSYEDDDNDLGSSFKSQSFAAVRTKTLGNPFDSGNSTAVLLAVAHRNAFSTITNPFASGQFNTTSVKLPQQQQTLQSPDEAKRALQQCVRLFEFSGVNLAENEVSISNELIGRGAFSLVFRGTMVKTGEEVAVKELSIEEFGTNVNVILDFRAEVALMKAIHHPNVLQLIGACTSPKLRLISEFCHRGNLFDFLYFDRNSSATTQSKVLTWPLRIRLALGEARGMHFLHTAFPVPLIHRDLKSLNLLLSKNFQLKVSDFGLSRFRSKNKGESQQGPIGTLHWMAPEVIEGKMEYDEKADVYSFGINLWELASRRIPWEGEKDVKRKVVAGERLSLTEGSALDVKCPPDFVALIQACWHQQPHMRPDFGSICKTLKRMAREMKDMDKV